MRADLIIFHDYYSISRIGFIPELQLECSTTYLLISLKEKSERI